MASPYLTRRLRRWEAAGLIDAATRERILAWEAANGHGWVTRGLLGLGALILGIGLISLVAANWQRIPAALKLMTDLVLLSGLGWAIYTTRPQSHAREFFIFLFQLACLASIGLIAQIYHLSSEPWQALTLWTAMLLPVTLFARTGLPWSAWSAGLLAALGLWLDEMMGWSSIGAWLMEGWLLAQIALLFQLLGLRFRLHPIVEAFGVWTLVLGLALTFGIDMVLHGGGSFSRLFFWLWPGYLLSLAVLGMAYSGRLLRKGGVPILTLLLVLVGGAISFLTMATPPLFGNPHHGLAGALFSIGVLGLGLALSAVQGWRGAFRIFLVFLGLRIYGVYIEAFGGLAVTGIGLIISGLLLIAMVLLMRRIQSRFGGASS